SEHQADLLARLARGERVNEHIDWPNLIEEVRDLGLSELRSCRSWVGLVCLHLLKLKLSPDSADVPHWQSEIEEFLDQLQNHFTSSMAQLIDVAHQYARARLKCGRADRQLLLLIPEKSPTLSRSSSPRRRPPPTSLPS
ncbi:MAG: DUF29 family protein, partial [Acetobacteraceae bacterium]|nr:DUF29 family protein [Acetobacteraceae bacterium]